MDRKRNFSFRIGDFVAICSVLILAIVIFIGYFLGNRTSENVKVQIFQDGELLVEFPLDSSEEIVYIVEGEYQNKIVIRDGEVFIDYANCPGTDCVHSGNISKPGRSLVCLPNKVEVRITGNSDTDIIVG